MVKIPKHAKKVFEGIVYDIYQWEQELYDGSITTFEKAVRETSVGMITIVEDKILMLREEQPLKNPFICIPAGGCEKGETSEQGARRELLEETGFQPEELILFKDIGISGGKFEWPSYIYIAKNCKKVAEPNLDPGEKIQSYLVSFEEFFEEVEKPECRDKHIKDFLLRIKQTPKELEDFKKLLFD